MQITRQADYAVRAILYLARVGRDERSSTSQVAKEQNIPPSFLAKIISQLSIAGLLHTARGGVTLGDIREAQPSDATVLSVYELNYLLDKLTAKEFMTHDPLTISPDATIGEAARLMVEHKIGGLPVVEGGELVGIITETDFCRLLILQPEIAA